VLEPDDSKGSRRVCAARRFVVSPAQPGGTRRNVLGSTAYLEAKARGDSSMPVKRWPPEASVGGAPQDPCDMAKAGLPAAQSPAGASDHPSERRLEPMPDHASARTRGRGNLRGTDRRPARTVKEMSGRPTSRSIRTTKTNAGSPVGREPYGDGVPIVVVGVTSHQGGRESRPQGEGAQVIEMSGHGRHA
jgi:hypothetical protein